MASLYTAAELLANSEQVGLIKVEQTMTNEGDKEKEEIKMKGIHKEQWFQIKTGKSVIFEV